MNWIEQEMMPDNLKKVIKWRKCKAGYRFPSEAVVIPLNNPDDTDPRLVKTAVWDSKYILVSDLLTLDVE